MDDYVVSYMVIYSDTVQATSPEEAARLVEDDCPYDVDGTACVVNLRTGETFEI